jgi:hypothetical protein
MCEHNHPKDIILFFFSVLGLELRAFILSHSTNPFFVMNILKIGFLELFAQGWLGTGILLISAS